MQDVHPILSAAPARTRHTVRQANISDLDFLMRAQLASQFESVQLDREELASALLAGMEAYLLVGGRSRMCIVVQKDGRDAALSMFYREGPRVGLLAESRMLLEKVIDRLQANGVTSICGFVHARNPRRHKLLKLYRRLGLEVDLVRIGRLI